MRTKLVKNSESWQAGDQEGGDNEICPKCGKEGYHYNVPSWNARYKGAPRNLYPRFIHSDRNLNCCYINTNIKPRDAPFQVAKEFNRVKRQLTTFQYNPEEIEISDVTKQVKNNISSMNVHEFSNDYLMLVT